MACGKLREVVRNLRGFELSRDARGSADAQLLDCFARHRDEAAFAATGPATARASSRSGRVLGP
jgi:hypothetical protein